MTSRNEHKSWNLLMIWIIGYCTDTWPTPGHELILASRRATGVTVGQTIRSINILNKSIVFSPVRSGRSHQQLWLKTSPHNTHDLFMEEPDQIERVPRSLIHGVLRSQSTTPECLVHAEWIEIQSDKKLHHLSGNCQSPIRFLS